MNAYEMFLDEIRKRNVNIISEKSGVSINTIYGWTSGMTTPKLTTAMKVADAMGMEFLLFDKLHD